MIGRDRRDASLAVERVDAEFERLKERLGDQGWGWGGGRELTEMITEAARFRQTLTEPQGAAA